MLKISVVVPSYNQGQYIEETLLSIIDQGYPNLEILVADGGSTDNSVDIIKKYEQHIQWWVSEKDKGQSDAINKGFRKATGDIVTWLCSDDLFTPGTLKSVNEHFMALPEEVGVIHGGVTMFKEKEMLDQDYGYPNPCTERNISGMAFSQPAAFIRKKYLDQIGGQVSETLHYGMDYDMFSRLAMVCRFQPVKDMYALYRLHESSKSVSQQDKFIIDWCRVYVNFCKNAGWTDILQELTNASPLQVAMNYHQPFSFIPNSDILNAVDKRRSLFYHLTYQVRSFYASGKIRESRDLLKYIKNNFSKEWLNDEKRLDVIRTRLKLPTAILLSLRAIKAKK